MEKSPQQVMAEIANLQKELARIESSCPHNAENLSLTKPNGGTGQAEFLGSTITCAKCGLSVHSKPVGEISMFERLFDKIHKENQ